MVANTRELDYTVLLGDDLKDSATYISDNLIAFRFHNDQFIFNSSWTALDVDQFYRHLDPKVDECHILGLTQRCFNDKYAGNIATITRMMRCGAQHQRLSLYGLDWKKPLHGWNHLKTTYDSATRDLSPPRLSLYNNSESTENNPCNVDAAGVKSGGLGRSHGDIGAIIRWFSKSGYMHTTDDKNSIYNLIEFTGAGHAYILSVVVANFIDKAITKPIERAFLNCIAATGREPNFHTGGMRLPFRKYDSLKDFLNEKIDFREALKEDEEFQNRFTELPYRNVLINMRVLGKEFLR